MYTLVLIFIRKVRQDRSSSVFSATLSFEIILSAEIVEEVLQALAYPKIRKAVRGKVDTELWFEDILVLPHLISGDLKITGVSEDPDDSKYHHRSDGGACGARRVGRSRSSEHWRIPGRMIITPRAFLDLLHV